MADAGVGWGETARGLWKQILAMTIVGVLAVLYVSGRLDYTLYPLGLNFHQCARNGIGATFCGNDLTAYEARWGGVEQQVKAAQQRIQSIESQQVQP